MTPRQDHQLARGLATAAAALLLVTGCGEGPALAGAAATVGDQRITTKTLEEVVARGLASDSAKQSVGADPAAYTRSVLRRLIDHELLARTAQRLRISVSKGDALETRQRIAEQVGGSESALQEEALKQGIAPPDLDQLVADAALREVMGDKLTAGIAVPQASLARAYQQNIKEYDQVHAAHILVSDPALAQRLLAQVRADPGSFGALAKKYSTDPGSKAIGGDLGFQGRGVFTKPFEDAVFGAKPGTFLTVKSEFGYHVIRVIERRTTSLQAATRDLRRTLLGEQRSQAISEQMHLTAQQSQVRVNPRFGVWDFEGLEIVDPKQDDTSVTKPSPRPSEPPAGAPGLTPP